MKILLIRFSSLGDVLLNSSIVHFFKLIYQDKVEIFFLTYEEYIEVLDPIGGISEVIAIKKPKKVKDYIGLLKDSKFTMKMLEIDLIIDLHQNWRSLFFKTVFFKTPSITLDKRKWERFFLINLKLNLYRDKNHIKRIWKDFFPIFSSLDGAEREVFFTNTYFQLKKKTNEIDYLDHRKKLKQIIIFPIAAHDLKRWPQVNYINYIKLLSEKIPNDFQIKVVCGPNDFIEEEFQENKMSIKQNYQLIRSKKIKETVEIVSNALLLVGNDTGAMHLASMFSIPSITLFGATSEYFGFSPIYPQKQFTLSRDIWCRPCTATGSGFCFRKNKKECLTEIRVGDLIDQTLKIIL